MQCDLQLSEPVCWVLAFLVDLQVLKWHRIPTAAVRRQLVHQLVLAGQRQTKSRLSPVSETQFPPLARGALDTSARFAGLGAQRQQSLAQQAVE